MRIYAERRPNEFQEQHFPAHLNEALRRCRPGSLSTPLTTRASPIPRRGKELRMSTQPKSTRKWWALALIAAAQFMVIMDTSIIGVALPRCRAISAFPRKA